MPFTAWIAFLMTTAAAVPSGHPLCIQPFDGEIRRLPAICIDVGGEILDAQDLRDGGVVALVQDPGAGMLQVVRWNGELNAPPKRRPLQLDGLFRCFRVRADGDLVIVTERAVVRVASDGTIAARRPLVEPPGAIAAAAPDGAWLFAAGRVTWFGLNGSERSLTGPWPAPRWRPGQVTPPGRPAQATLYATMSNDAVLVEDIVEEHQVAEHQPNDVTRTLIVTCFDREGRTLGQTSIGDVRRRWEWFWTESSSSNPTPFPSHFGLVRTRWEGTVELSLIAEQPDGGIILALEFRGERGTTLKAFDQRLRERWSRRIKAELIRAASPPWARGLLFLYRFSAVTVCDDRGRSKRSVGFDLPKPFGETAPGGASVGQTPTGEWYIVLW